VLDFSPQVIDPKDAFFMYCPKCLHNTLRFSSKGVVGVVINGKQMDAGRLLYSVDDLQNDRTQKELHGKIEEFFRWYSNFNNPDPIQTLELLTADLRCQNNCSLPHHYKVTIVDNLIPSKSVMGILEKMGVKYKMEIKIKPD
jgi:hypothetical protein